MAEAETEKKTVKKTTQRQGIPGLIERVTANPTRTFFTVLLVLAIIFLGYGNWPLVRFSLLGINIDLPGTLLYLLFFLVGMLVMALWGRSPKPPKPTSPGNKPK